MENDWRAETRIKGLTVVQDKPLNILGSGDGTAAAKPRHGASIFAVRY
jgi:hypothetical protein